MRRALGTDMAENEAKLAAMLCISAWLSPVIPDYSDVGPFSNHAMAKVYHRACRILPRLLIEAALGGRESTRTRRGFMDEWERYACTLRSTARCCGCRVVPRFCRYPTGSGLPLLRGGCAQSRGRCTLRVHLAPTRSTEDSLSEQDLELRDTIHAQDRGPLLYWLLNERRLFGHTQTHPRAPASAALLLSAFREPVRLQPASFLAYSARNHSTEAQRQEFARIFFSARSELAESVTPEGAGLSTSHCVS
jgi:hypothetical protein